MRLCNWTDRCDGRVLYFEFQVVRLEVCEGCRACNPSSIKPFSAHG